MKRGPHRAWPKGIVEIPATRIDPRADPGATQKISREQLDEALKRTKSGTRPALRSDSHASYDEESFAGPRDDAPQITIVRIDSVELSTIDPSTLPEAKAEPSPHPWLGAPTPSSPSSPSTTAAPSASSADALPSRTSYMRAARTTLAQRFRTTPRTAFIAGIAVATFLVLAALAGFFAGRVTGH